METDAAAAADSAAQAYQDLSRTYSAIEPPTWCLLLAQSCRSKGYGVAILDCGAERLTHAQAASRILETKARVVCFCLPDRLGRFGLLFLQRAHVWNCRVYCAHWPQLWD